MRLKLRMKQGTGLIWGSEHPIPTQALRSEAPAYLHHGNARGLTQVPRVEILIGRRADDDVVVEHR